MDVLMQDTTRTSEVDSKQPSASRPKDGKLSVISSTHVDASCGVEDTDMKTLESASADSSVACVGGGDATESTQTEMDDKSPTDLLSAAENAATKMEAELSVEAQRSSDSGTTVSGAHSDDGTVEEEEVATVGVEPSPPTEVASAVVRCADDAEKVTSVMTATSEPATAQRSDDADSTQLQAAVCGTQPRDDAQGLDDTSAVSIAMPQVDNDTGIVVGNVESAQNEKNEDKICADSKMQLDVSVASDPSIVVVASANDCCVPVPTESMPTIDETPLSGERDAEGMAVDSMDTADSTVAKHMADTKPMDKTAMADTLMTKDSVANQHSVADKTPVSSQLPAASDVKTESNADGNDVCHAPTIAIALPVTVADSISSAKDKIAIEILHEEKIKDKSDIGETKSIAKTSEEQKSEENTEKTGGSMEAEREAETDLSAVASGVEEKKRAARQRSPSVEEMRTAIREVMLSMPIAEITAKAVRSGLEDKFNCRLSSKSKKKQIRTWAADILANDPLFVEATQMTMAAEATAAAAVVDTGQRPHASSAALASSLPDLARDFASTTSSTRSGADNDEVIVSSESASKTKRRRNTQKRKSPKSKKVAAKKKTPLDPLAPVITENDYTAMTTVRRSMRNVMRQNLIENNLLQPPMTEADKFEQLIKEQELERESKRKRRETALKRRAKEAKSKQSLRATTTATASASASSSPSKKSRKKTSSSSSSKSRSKKESRKRSSKRRREDVSDNSDDEQVSRKRRRSSRGGSSSKRSSSKRMRYGSGTKVEGGSASAAASSSTSSSSSSSSSASSSKKKRKRNRDKGKSKDRRKRNSREMRSTEGGVGVRLDAAVSSAAKRRKKNSVATTSMAAAIGSAAMRPQPAQQRAYVSGGTVAMAQTQRSGATLMNANSMHGAYGFQTVASPPTASGTQQPMVVMVPQRMMSAAQAGGGQQMADTMVCQVSDALSKMMGGVSITTVRAVREAFHRYILEQKLVENGRIKCDKVFAYLFKCDLIEFEHLDALLMQHVGFLPQSAMRPTLSQVPMSAIANPSAVTPTTGHASVKMSPPTKT